MANNKKGGCTSSSNVGGKKGRGGNGGGGNGGGGKCGKTHIKGKCKCIKAKGHDKPHKCDAGHAF